MSSIALTQVIFGIGNQNHNHVHRHITMFAQSQDLDKLMSENMDGGVRSSTLGSVAMMSGQISAQPQGFVEIEDGWNQRRGIACLKFIEESNVAMSSELVVLCYLVGGIQDAVGGVSTDTMLVPVRCYSNSLEQKNDGAGFPIVKRTVDNSQQFLMGDPNLMKKMHTLRPIDVGEEYLGLEALDQENRLDDFDGGTKGDLSNGIVVSKTANLDPTVHARELLRLATNAGMEGTQMGLGISDNLYTPGLAEHTLGTNAFFHAMMTSTGGWNTSGFTGYSVGEVSSVFANFVHVMNTEMLATNNFAADETLLTSSAYGSAAPAEFISHELASLTVHLLVKAGLASFEFSGTNNPNDFGGMLGSDEGMVVMPGPASSLMDQDDELAGNVIRCIELIKTNFFMKYTPQNIHERTIMNVVVQAHMFGETVVRICFNGDVDNVVEYTNATYCINRNSTNIAGKELAMQQTKQYYTNIRDHFAIPTGTQPGNDEYIPMY